MKTKHQSTRDINSCHKDVTCLSTLRKDRIENPINSGEVKQSLTNAQTTFVIGTTLLAAIQQGHKIGLDIQRHFLDQGSGN